MLQRVHEIRRSALVMSSLWWVRDTRASSFVIKLGERATERLSFQRNNDEYKFGAKFMNFRGKLSGTDICFLIERE